MLFYTPTGSVVVIICTRTTIWSVHNGRMGSGSAAIAATRCFWAFRHPDMMVMMMDVIFT